MPKKLVSASTLAEVLGISTRRVTQLVSAGVLPRDGRNSYPLVECRRRYAEYHRSAEASGDESTYLEYLRVSNDLLEMQNQLARGDRIYRDDYTIAMSRNLQATRSRLLALPQKAAPLITGNDDKVALSILQRMVMEARRELERPIDFRRIALDAVKKKSRR